MLLPICRSTPTSACCEYGLRYPGCALKSTLNGGTGPVWVMLIPNGARSCGVIHETFGAVACGQLAMAVGNKPPKMHAEVKAPPGQTGAAPTGGARGTNTWAICRTPLTNPRVF